MLIRLKASKGLFSFPNQTILKKLHQASPELARLLKGKIQGRTYEWTGGLKSSIKGLGSPNGTGSRLVSLYAADGPQLSAWGRVYVAYQEGPPLGKSTYTNDARQMFYRVQSDDADDIQAWADSAAKDWESELEGMGDIVEEFGVA